MSIFQWDRTGQTNYPSRLFAINEITFEREVLHSNQIVLVHFWAPWCGLCRIILPILEKLQMEHEEVIKLVTINADENFKLATAYRLANLPTILLFQDTKLVARLDDFKNREGLHLTLEHLIDNILNTVSLKS